MWPWEHLAVGYLAYSVGKRALGYEPPGRGEVLVLVLATQLPDLIDKPLGWGTTLLPSGVSLAHSLLVAVPVVVVLYAVASLRGRRDLALAFGTGYLLHPPSDVLATYLLDGYLFLGAMFWPLSNTASIQPQPIFGRTSELFFEYLAVIRTPAGMAYVALELLLLGAAFVAWFADRRTRRAGRGPADVPL